MQKQLDLLPDIFSSKPARSADARTWLLRAAATWSDFHRRPMTVKWARDVTLVRPLLRQHGEHELLARWGAYVRAPDEYLARRGWDVPGFSRSIDRFKGNTDVAENVRRWLRLREIDEANARDPLTGAPLIVRRQRK